jgi:hypothetical protein
MASVGMSRSGASPERLLGMLAMAGFVRGPEVAVTSSLAWLARRRHVANGLAAMVERSGVNVGSDSEWFAEVLAEDGTRTDLTCVQGDSRAPVVVVEAKLDAALTTEQLRHYAADQRHCLQAAGLEQGLLVALVPAHRRQEAEQKVASALRALQTTDVSGGDAVTLRGAVWSFDELLQEITPTGGEDPDVAQLAALVVVQQALDIRPFTSDELVRPDESRRHDLRLIADRVSAAITPAGIRLFPSGQDADFDWRRYVELAPGDTNVAIGVRRPSGDVLPAGSTSPLWLRVHRDTPNAAAAAQRLALRYPSTVTGSGGHTWLALEVPTEMGGADLVDELVRQLRQITDVIVRAELD